MSADGFIIERLLQILEGRQPPVWPLASAAIAVKLSDTDITAVAAYYETRRRGGTGANIKVRPTRQGEKVVHDPICLQISTVCCGSGSCSRPGGRDAGRKLLARA
jgi:hypothetical protein